jgi:hypothetical protein
MQPRTVLLALALVLPLSLAASPAADLAGTWRMVEQSYGEGSNNLADLSKPLYLELSRTPAGWAGKIWAGDEGAAPVDWPAFANDVGLLPVEVVEIVRDEADGLRATYRVRPAENDPLVLEIREDYRLDRDGALRGTMHVKFTTPEGERGSFVLHRRFERVP